MKLLVGRSVLIAALLLVGTMTTPADAATVTHGNLAWNGVWQYNPGLTTTPTAQSGVTYFGQVGGYVKIFDTTSMFLWTAFLLPGTCTFSGSSTGTEDLTFGTGSVSGTCHAQAMVWTPVVTLVPSSGTFDLSCSLGYTRYALTTLVLTGTCTASINAFGINTSATAALTGTHSLAQIPAGALPAKSFSVLGANILT
jgi:hypothetical protein